jgi:hypothetical protein
LQISKILIILEKMALVADYGSDSSGSCDEEEDDNQQKPSSSSSSKTVANILPSSSSSSTIAKSKVLDHFFTNDSSDDDNETEDITSSLGQSFSLPKPKLATDFPFETEIENDPIPPKKTYGDEEKPPPPTLNSSSFPNLMTSKVKGVVRIAAPSLKDVREIKSMF